jgi:hypothetical protein
MKQMLEQARQLQAKLQAMQEDLARREVQGQAGDGAVRITLNGRAELLAVQIAPAAAGDAELLEDLVAIAFRDAHTKVQEMVQREMGGMGGPFAGLPPGL